MGLFKSSKKVGLFADVIRCDESDHLIWKWHPDGTEAGTHGREYAIRFGSKLRVREGEVAVFAYKQSGSVFNDYIVGPFEDTLHTKNIPVIGAIIASFWGGDTPFQAEVYFINTAKNIQIKFGVPFFDICDERFPDFTVPVAVRGSINFKIEDYREFVKIYRLENFTLSDFSARIRDSAVRCVKNVVTNVPAVHGIPVIQIERRISAINEIVELNISERLSDDFGVTVTGVDITAIEIDKSSAGYRGLMAVTRDVTAATAEAKAEADIATIKARAEADNEDYLERKRMEREADAYDRTMKTRSENITAYSVGESTKVGVAGAAALGDMGASGATSVDVGGASFNPAGMMAGMAIGSVVAESVAGTMRTAMSGASVPPAAPAAALAPAVAVPPPIPTVAFHVAKDGAATGPFDMATLSAMAARGDLRGDMLVWRAGMPAWARADSVSELAGLFPPPII